MQSVDRCLGSLKGLLAAAALLLCCVSSAQAEYRLGSGDVLEISLYGVTDFKRRVTVNVDGDVSLPFLGQVHAGGSSVGALREQIKDALVSQNIIRSPDVTVDLVELRPFFINGDVSKPGPHPYRPNLTVRRAVAIAGGYDLVRLKVDNPLLMAAEVRGQYEGLWAEFVRREARVISQKAELEGKPVLDFSTIEQAPIATRIITEITRLETDHFEARRLDLEKERQHLAQALTLAQKAMQQLSESHEQESLGSKLLAESLERTSALSAKGLAVATRVFDEQRAGTLQRSHQLETGSRLADSQQRVEEAARRLDKLDSERRIQLSREVQESMVELERTRTQLQSVGEKLLYVGAMKSLLSRGGRNPPEIAIYRDVEGKPTWIPSDENTEVLAGDVVDVVFSQKQLMLYGSN